MTDIQPTGQPLDLNAIRARAEAATGGPWYFGGDTAVAQEMFQNHELIVSPTYPLMEFESSEQGEADAEFVAYARTDVPNLLAAIDRVTALVPSRIGAGHRIRDLVSNGDGVDVAFYAGVSFALAKVSRALRGDS